MLKNIIIREINIGDVSHILELIKELAVFEKEPESVVVSEKKLLRDGFGEYPLFKCFVACDKDKIVGMAFFYSRYSTWKGPTIHLEDLIVTRSYRNKGIGKSLFTKVIDYANSKGVKRLEWAVLNWNTPAIEFYKNAGADVFETWQTVQMNDIQMSEYLKNNS